MSKTYSRSDAIVRAQEAREERDAERFLQFIQQHVDDVPRIPRQRPITADSFKAATGHDAVNDDLERCNCEKAGEIGHRQCGWCDTCDHPKFMCGC